MKEAHEHDWKYGMASFEHSNPGEVITLLYCGCGETLVRRQPMPEKTVSAIPAHRTTDAELKYEKYETN